MGVDDGNFLFAFEADLVALDLFVRRLRNRAKHLIILVLEAVDQLVPVPDVMDQSRVVRLVGREERVFHQLDKRSLGDPEIFRQGSDLAVPQVVEDPFPGLSRLG